jgi:hypothetical protein
MKIKFWKHENVAKDGRYADGSQGGVETSPTVHIDYTNLFILISAGLNESGEVRGVTLRFESSKELSNFMLHNTVTFP